MSQYIITNLSPGSFEIFGAFFSIEPTKAGVALKPLVAISIAGPKRAFQGRLPYFFQAISKPRSSPGTPINSPSPGTWVFCSENVK